MSCSEQTLKNASSQTSPKLPPIYILPFSKFSEEDARSRSGKRKSSFPPIRLASHHQDVKSPNSVAGYVVKSNRDVDCYDKMESIFSPRRSLCLPSIASAQPSSECRPVSPL